MSLKIESQKWWNEVKQDPEKFATWLQKQYRGEITAAERIVQLADTYGTEYRHRRTLYFIAGQELQHAKWILNLLEAREIPVISITDAENRYWRETMPGITSFENGCGVAAHAEAMRLARIEVIAEDADAPDDVRETFKCILRDELFHERAFRGMAGDAAMAATAAGHELGLKTLGLVS